MIGATRRTALIGALALPAAAGLASWRFAPWQESEGGKVLLHDPSLEAGRRFAAASAVQGHPALAVEGDRIRFAQQMLAGTPALIAGVTRHADFLLLADVAREAGYAQAAVLDTRAGRCSGGRCAAGWGGLARLGQAAGTEWAEALAVYAIDPARAGGHASTGSWFGAADAGLVLGWVLVRQGRTIGP